MAKNRLFIYDKDSNTAVCIAKGNAERWGKITDNGSSEMWFGEIVKEAPGHLGEMCRGDTKLVLKTEGALPLLCNIINVNPKEPDNRPVITVESVQVELDQARESLREKSGMIQARDGIIKDLREQMRILETDPKEGIDTEVYLSMVQEKDLLQSQVSKLIDILHTKEKGYFD